MASLCDKTRESRLLWLSTFRVQEQAWPRASAGHARALLPQRHAVATVRAYIFSRMFPMRAVVHG